jgi:hypothetical protein
MAKKTFECDQDGFHFLFRFSNDRRCIEVDAYVGGKLVMEWAYPKVAGNSLLGNVAVWRAQAVLQAKGEVMCHSKSA